MDANTTITLGFLLAFVGGVGGVVGLISNRDAKKNSEGRWQGIIDTKLDNITYGQTLMLEEFKNIKEQLSDHESRIVVLELKRTRKPT